MEKDSPKEINLIGLLQILFNGIKWLFIKIFQTLGEMIRLIYRHKILTIVIAILSVLIGYYLGRPSNREYKVEGIAIINGASAQTVKEIAKKLEWANYFWENTSISYKVLLPDSITYNFFRFESFYVVDYQKDNTADVVDFNGSHSWKDTLNVRMPNHLYFTFRTKNIAMLPEFEFAFAHFFNRDPLLKKEFEYKKRTLEEKIEMTNKEINRLDSLADVMYFNESGVSTLHLTDKAVTLGEKKQLLFPEIRSLYDYRSKLESEYASFTAPVVLPAGFNVFPIPYYDRWVWWLITCSIGFVAIIILSLLIEYRKRIFKYLSKKPTPKA